MKLTNLLTKSLGAAVLATALLTPAAAHARTFFQVVIAPPEIPVYDQPLCPGDGYIWTPGYWAYGDQGYLWVDGAWVLAPYDGALWTPGYWGFDNGLYAWNAGYWGTSVGYYGGIDYGFGYFGTGFYGGYWNGGRFFYNRGYNHLNFSRIHNIYNDPYRGGTPVHPGGRGFDPHPRDVGNNRGSNFGNHDNHGLDAHGPNDRGQDNRGYNDGRGFAGDRGNAGTRGDSGSGQMNGNAHIGAIVQMDDNQRNGGQNGNQNNVNNVQQQRPSYGGFGNRPDATGGEPQRSFTGNQAPGTNYHVSAPQSVSQPAQPARSFSQPAYNGGQQQQRSYSAPAAPQQQHFSAPSAPQQHFSAPSAPSGGGGSHGGNGGHR